MEPVLQLPSQYRINKMEKQILLVDDEEDIRDVLGVYLKDQGYKVFMAGNGEEALKIFAEHKAPIVLSDIKMPGIDGIELLKRIKQDNPDTEFIMITGHGDMDLAIASFHDQAADFITKPINVNILDISLKKLQEKIKGRRQLREYTENLERLIKEKSELQSHLSSLGLMIGSVSHGIKGLLTGLDGGMYMVESGFSKSNTAQIDEGWTIVKLMVDRIRKMVLDILYYAKERNLNWEKVEVLSFAREVADIMERKISSHGIELIRDFNKLSGNCKIDTGYINSALINIFENAVDACINDKLKEKHQISFKMSQDKDNIYFEVSDNGIGMDRETRDKLFTLFFSSKGSKGTGLGLFISNKIIEQHGGSIKVFSTPGQGSKFTINIPKLMPS
ncbi:MAG: response regulator [Desulfobacterium sp.]|nr:response regulator [Desulfobacterium sp.]MBU3950312.1 response regulator [Pseudomonadota bacterium]MBU4035018.1 response regulator [Pseudomonadota bacterium]